MYIAISFNAKRIVPNSPVLYIDHLRVKHRIYQPSKVPPGPRTINHAQLNRPLYTVIELFITIFLELSCGFNKLYAYYRLL